jgi:hypothetical protein
MDVHSLLVPSRKQLTSPNNLQNSVGEDVGGVVGTGITKSVGDAEGSLVGEEIGDSVGIPVGGDDGDKEGVSEGVKLGEPVGSVVGEVVGDTVGEAMGDKVGEAVGKLVGDEVGLPVGATVGLLVGEKVLLSVLNLYVSFFLHGLPLFGVAAMASKVPKYLTSGPQKSACDGCFKRRDLPNGRTNGTSGGPKFTVSMILFGLFFFTFPTPICKTTDVMFSGPRPLLPTSMSQVTSTKQF